MLAVQAHMAQPCEGALRRAETTSLLPSSGLMFAVQAHMAQPCEGAQRRAATTNFSTPRVADNA
jgi:hypothetical protein